MKGAHYKMDSSDFQNRSRPLSRNTGFVFNEHVMNRHERRALERVRRAGVAAPESAILALIYSVGPETILSARLCDIRAVANAF
jgi:hypothetical protein